MDIYASIISSVQILQSKIAAMEPQLTLKYRAAQRLGGVVQTKVRLQVKQAHRSV